MRARRNPIYAGDIRQLGGVVSVCQQRDRCGEGPVFRVSHVSAGGDIAFTSAPIPTEDHATAAARVLGEFVGVREVKIFAPKAERAALAGDPIAISKVLAKPIEYCTSAEDFQQRRVARLFLLTPETAATVARLAFGCGS